MSLKLHIPIPASRGSPAFAQALKVCLAAAAYDVAPTFVPAPGATSVYLEIVKEQTTLIESNAIVRYLAETGATAWTPGSAVEKLKDLARIEWEESRLSRELKENVEVALGNLEEIIKAQNWDLTGAPGPSVIVLLSSVYDTLGSADPAVLKSVPALNEWFTKVLATDWARKGIEAVTIQTSEQKPQSAKEKKAAAAASSKVPKKPLVQKINDAAFMKIPKEGEKILPSEGENVLITSALPYVNNVPHLGNIVGSVLSADCFARYKKARNVTTLYICGTDEYGTATETKALEVGCTPKELCDKYHKVHSDVYKWFDIGFDYFGRTSTPAQTEICHEIFEKIHANGFTSEDSMRQLFCEKHQGFLADRFVEGTCPKPGCGYDDARGDQCDKCGNLLDPFELINPRCKLDGTTPIPRDSKHIFLALDKLQPEIEAWVEKSNANGKWSKNGKIITDTWLKEGLRPRCITRDLKWGVPVPPQYPEFANKVFYVWYDAPIGYPSITANYTGDDGWRKWWQNPDNVKLYQFMGKDNVPFHTVIFPGCEIGTRDPWTLLHHISTTEYLQYENGKFSKSRGVGVFGDSAQATGVPSSVWRYYLLSSRPETSDTQFLWRDFITKNNSELLNNLGNLVNRVVKFLNAKFGGEIPEYSSDDVPAGKAFKDDIAQLLTEYNTELEAVHLRAGLDKAMHISARGNLFLQENKLDNALFASEPKRCAAVIGLAANLIYLLSAVFYPYMPGTSASILRQLNAPPRRIPDGSEGFPEDLKPGHVIAEAEYLFKLIDPKMEDAWRAAYGGQNAGADVAAKEEKKKKKGKAKTEKKKTEATGEVVVPGEGVSGVLKVEEKKE